MKIQHGCSQNIVIELNPYNVTTIHLNLSRSHVVNKTHNKKKSCSYQHDDHQLYQVDI